MIKKRFIYNLSFMIFVATHANAVDYSCPQPEALATFVFRSEPRVLVKFSASSDNVKLTSQFAYPAKNINLKHIQKTAVIQTAVLSKKDRSTIFECDYIFDIKGKDKKGKFEIAGSLKGKNCRFSNNPIPPNNGMLPEATQQCKSIEDCKVTCD